MTRHIIVLLVLGILSGTISTPAAAAPPPAIGFFGLNTYISGNERLGNDGEAGINRLIAAGREAGAGWAREEISWANLEPRAKGKWNWDNMDRRIGQLSQAGYHIVGMLLTTPEWARVADCRTRARAARTETYWCPPADPRDYKDFVWTVVERYDGDGIFDAPGSPRIAAWQIWNEPSAPLTWPGSPAEYGSMLVEAYKAAKAADPHAIVALGGVYIFDGLGTDPTDGLPFYDAMIRAVPESLHTFDALAIHPFMTAAAPDEPGIHATITFWGRILTAQRWLKERPGIQGVRPLWISEFGWETCTCSAGCPPRTVPSAELAANYLTRAYAVALALGVQHASYFQLEDKFDGKWGGPCSDAAALLADRGANYRATPGFAAYRTLTGLLNGASFSGFGSLHRYRLDPNDQNYAGVYHLRFRDANGHTVDMLWRTVGAQEITLPLRARRGEFFSRDGERIALTGAQARITIGESPVYLRQP